MKRILVVDDDQSIRDLMTDVLHEDGWIVSTARNGADALSQMRGFAHDLVVLDLMMPVLDGLAVLAVRQADQQLRAVPVLAISAGGDSALNRARALGANGCMPKPFELDDILAALRAIGRTVGLAK